MQTVADGEQRKQASVSVQESACARLAMLGRHVGSGLMAADMAVMLAQKRQESLARAEALAPRFSLPVKALTAHRCERRPQHYALLSAELCCMTLSAAPATVYRAYIPTSRLMACVGRSALVPWQPAHARSSSTELR